MENEASREMLRGIVDLTPMEVAEMQVLKEKITKKGEGKEECKKEFARKVKYLTAGIPEIYWDLGMEHFVGDPSAKEIVERYLSLFEEMIEGGLGLLFLGGYGTGKTMLSCIIGKHAIEKGYTVRYMPIASILDNIMAGFGDKAVKERLNTIVTRVEILIIDDWGKEYQGFGDKLGPLVTIEFDRIFRDRINRKKVTIGSSNYGADDIVKKYGYSIMSVLSASMQIVKVTGTDHRLAMTDKIKAKLLGKK